jgi:hypothetical protein
MERKDLSHDGYARDRQRIRIGWKEKTPHVIVMHVTDRG